MLTTPEIHDEGVLETAVRHARSRQVVLPRLAELAAPDSIEPALRKALGGVSMNAASPLNLYRIHWFNDHDGGLRDTPAWLELPPTLTGVAARIVVVLGDAFPMIAAHKVLAAYACLATRLVSGRFDPGTDRAVWPSTGNYCRGGIAISRILGCRGVAVLPEMMSRERFAWLEQWALHPDEDIVRTTGSESNVKEIYDACDELSRDPSNVVLNQFNEFANYLCHRAISGPALGLLFEAVAGPSDRLQAFIAGTGSAGTMAAGDYLKQHYGAAIAATEPLECPTMLANGYGEHGIQGIGDKHIPLIQNVMNMDYVVGISDTGPDLLNVLFNTDAGRRYLVRRTGADEGLIRALGHVGLSGIANIQSAIKLARYHDLDERAVLLCVATDGAAMYASELEQAIERSFRGRFDTVEAAEVFGRCLAGCEPAHVMELTSRERERIFNLGYYTWVEQRGVSVDDFNLRRRPEFWNGVAGQLEAWDDLIGMFNARVAA